MRLVVVTLFILNIGYAFWQMQRSPEPEFPRSTPEEVAPTITLLSEVGNSRRRQELDMVVNNPVQADSQENDVMCDALGPFPDIMDGQAVLERLEALDIVVRLQALDEPTGENDFRVMIPPVASLEEAFRKLRELQSQDIDSYVITKGADALAISLGVYSSEDAARVAQESHLKDGYEGQITRIPRLDRSFWLIHQESTSLMISESLFQELLSEFPQITRASLNCIPLIGNPS